MDEGGDDKVRAQSERGQNFDRDARKERFEFLGYSLAALLVEEWPAVSARALLKTASADFSARP